MCEGDRLWLALRFKALHCFKVSFGSPVPRDGSTVSSFSDKCNPILLKDSTSCNQMSPFHKCTVLKTFSERRKQKIWFCVGCTALPKTQENLINSHPLSSNGLYGEVLSEGVPFSGFRYMKGEGFH